MGLIIEVVTATVNSEGQLVKVDVLTVSKLETCVLGDVGERATTRCPHREVLVSAVISTQ